jgi:quercetin dioxygenase-like cupin family protein
MEANSMIRPLEPLLHLIAGALLGLSSALPAEAETVGAAPPPAQLSPEVRNVLSTGRTVTGEQIRYLAGAPARIIALEITLQPGQQTGWHIHPVPLFGYILDGELTVDYGAGGQRTFVKGEGLAEAMNTAHNGRNMGQGPVRILAVFVGVESKPNTVAASPPAP